MEWFARIVVELLGTRLSWYWPQLQGAYSLMNLIRPDAKFDAGRLTTDIEPPGGRAGRLRQSHDSFLDAIRALSFAPVLTPTAVPSYVQRFPEAVPCRL